MANVTITQLPAAGPITGTESVPIVQNGQTVQTTTAAIAASPSQTQTFLTVNQEPTLPNSRRLTTQTGLGLTDNGAQSTYSLSLNGASGSLETALNGIVAKDGLSSVVARTLTASGPGLSITDGNGVSGNPTFSLTGLPGSLASIGSNGFLVSNSGSVNVRFIQGTANEIDVADGNGVLNSPTIGLADNLTLPGTGAVTVPIGTTAQQPGGAQGQIRFNSDSQTFDGYSAGQWRSFSQAGGVLSFSAGTTGFSPSVPTVGVVTLSGILNPASGGTGVNNGSFTTTLNGNVSFSGGFVTSGGFDVTLTSVGSTGVTLPTSGTLATLSGAESLTNKTMSGTSNTFSNIQNSSLANSSVTFNGTTVSLGGSGTITAATPNALTAGTGLQLNSGTTFDGSSAKTISIDSSVATLTGSQSLTNKTMSGTLNTFSDIQNSSLANSSVTFNGTTVSLGGSATITANTTNAVTFNNSGTGDASGTTFNGSAAKTISYNSIGASPLAGSTSFTTAGTITTGTWNATPIANNYLANSSITVGSTSIALGASSSTLSGLTSVEVTQNPTSALQLATKQYVDAVTEGLNVHASCSAATPDTLAALTGGTVTYNNGSSGVGATLTLGVALTTLDGYSLQNTNRVLVKNEANQAHNGIYTWATGGTVLTRATDFDTTTEVAAGDFTFVSNGTLYGGTGWVQTNNTTAIGTSPISFTQFSGAGTYSAGTGLTLSGSQFSLTSPVAASLGGTGNTSYTTGDLIYASASTTLSKLGIGASTSFLSSTGSAPQWTSPGALTKTDDTNVTLTLGGTPASALLAATSLTLGWTGQLAVGRGGTGAGTFTSNGVIYGNGTSALQVTAAGTTGQVLIGNTSAAPSWAAQSGLSVGTATNLAGGTTGAVPYNTGAGATTFLSLGTSGQVVTAGASAPQYVDQSTLSVGSATNATNTGITANSTNATNYLTFVSATSGNLPQLVNSGITCNPSTGSITGGVAGGSF